MSYAHADDDDGRISAFRNRLSAQTRKVIGEEFPIFQDHEDITWGEDWEARIDESLAEVTFFIPIITPSFFKSQYCRDELTRFLEREEKMGLKLILPVYYIETPLIENVSARSADELAQKISSRQYADCRDFFIEDLDSPTIRRLILKMSTQIRDVLEGLSTEAYDPPATALNGPKTDQLPTNFGRTAPKDIVVDPMHRGDYITITEAIEAANPGDKILVRPGLYQEGLVIDKPLEIVGEGELNEIEIQAMEKSALVFKTTNGRVANLTLRQIGGEGELYGVDIANGRLTLEDCDISSKNGACVSIHDGAHPRLRRNKIHDAEKSGVFVCDNGQGIIEESEIFGNAYAGVSITTGGNPVLRKNEIHNGKSYGIRVYDNGRGKIEENDIFGNSDSGVMIQTGGNPTLRKNKIYEGKRHGILVLKNGLGIIEENEIFRNANAGVAIETGGNPTLCRNKIYEGKQHGVHVNENGQGVLEDNDIFENAKYGVAIERGGNPTLLSNKIHDGKDIGVDISWKGLGILKDNDIFGNASHGVWIYMDSNPILRNNRINKNGSYAIWITDSCGTIEDNDLRYNAYGSLSVSEDSKSKVKLTNNLV